MYCTIRTQTTTTCMRTTSLPTPTLEPPSRSRRRQPSPRLPMTARISGLGTTPAPTCLPLHAHRHTAQHDLVEQLHGPLRRAGFLHREADPPPGPRANTGRLR